MSQKTQNSVYRRPKACQKDVRKTKVGRADYLDAEPLLINLGHLVGSLSTGGKVAAYTQVAAQLSVLAGLKNGHSWGWRYVASVHRGTMQPSKKFVRVLILLLQKISPREKQWFYFTRRRSVAAVYDKSIFVEMITGQMKSLGFKSVTFSRYMQVKNRAVHR